MVNKKRILVFALCAVLTVGSMAGCTNKKDDVAQEGGRDIADSSGQTLQAADVEQVKLTYKEEDLDAAWSKDGSTIVELNGTQATVTGSGAVSEGGSVTINSAGTYVLSGTLEDGQIRVVCTKKDKVRIILNGVHITSSTKEPFVVEEADKVIVTLADNTENTLCDKERAVNDTEEHSAVFSSKADTVFNGKGTLNINAAYRNGIKSSDDLLILSGNYNIISKEDGVIGKDILGIKAGNFSVKAGIDGMKSTNDTEEDRGDIVIEGGSFTITAGNDGIQSESDLMIYGGSFDITTGEGAANSESSKGLKAVDNILITDGSIRLNCKDDAIHSNASVKLTGGTYRIDSKDDGIHADAVLEIADANIDIQSSYEGLEAVSVLINSGTIVVNASDDGINAASGSDNAMPNRGGMGAMRAASSQTASAAKIQINGGDIYVNAKGDGIDSNGSIVMTGGNVVVSGPTDKGNGALDFDSTCTITGGTLMAFGSSGMLQKPSSVSGGCCIVAAFTAQAANSAVTLTDAAGTKILSYDSVEKAYESAVLYSEKIKSGETYTLQAGTFSVAVTASEGVTTSGSVGMNGMHGIDGGGNGGMHKGEIPELPGGQTPEKPELPGGQIPQAPENQQGGMQKPDGGMNRPKRSQSPVEAQSA